MQYNIVHGGMLYAARDNKIRNDCQSRWSFSG